MKFLSKIIKEEKGQVMVIVALAMVVLLGFTALAVDGGALYLARRQAATAADAAALAGALDLSNKTDAEDAARYYVQKNGAEVSQITTPYNGKSNQIEVIAKKNVNFTFARVLGFTQNEVSARAVAQKFWAGEALPFINLDDDYLADEEIVAWEKVWKDGKFVEGPPGNFESINDDDYEIINKDDSTKLYFKVDYLDGIELKEGTVAKIKQEVGYVYDQHSLSGKPVYVISLKSSVITSGKVKLKDGSIVLLSDLKNKDVIDPSQLVLLECIFHDYDDSGKTLYLTYTGKAYDIANGDSPDDYENPYGGISKLVE
jgi:hypothetical protein